MHNIKVRFSAIEEFLEELKKDAATGSVHRNIVRVVGETIPTNLSPHIRMVSIVATYRRDDEIIELRRFCGDYWAGMDTEGNKRTDDLYEELRSAVIKFCQENALEVRSGKYETEEKK